MMSNFMKLIGLLGLVSVMAWALPAHCAYCFPAECFDSSVCNAGCACFKLGGSLTGICAEAD